MIKNGLIWVTLSIILIFVPQVKGQDFNWIKNTSITYKVLWLSNDSVAPIVSTKYVVKVNLSEQQWKSLRSIGYKEWLSLLTDTNSDWAANLILYDIYKKNAIVFYRMVQNRNDWLPLKKTDIEYWKKHLHK